MSARTKTRQIEFGDFQTPTVLARRLTNLLSQQGISPSSLIEPTCGVGNLALAALDRFPTVRDAFCFDIEQHYIDAVRARLRAKPHTADIRVSQGDFFEMDWLSLVRELPEPVLVIGNPPWVTNSCLGGLDSSNLPQKSNFKGYRGLDAITGKGNFDISEWMLIRLLHSLEGRQATLAMLCKTAVARKVLIYAWKNRLSLESSAIYGIDAATHFGAAVDACFLVSSFSPEAHSMDALIYDDITGVSATRTIGYRDNQLVAEIDLYERWKHLQGGQAYRWRSGVKHDSAKVMEFIRFGTHYMNGLGEIVDLEPEHVFPLLKSSDVANGAHNRPRRWLLVTQQSVGADTSHLQRNAPRVWQYLTSHAETLDARRSAIYKNRPRFAIFGIGDYSFSPYKVAISSLYKKLLLRVVGSYEEKPILLDDTLNLIPCRTQAEAERLASLLNSEIARQFFQSLIFWDSKRPITIELLNRLDIKKLAREIGAFSRFSERSPQRELALDPPDGPGNP
ncbi:MAG: class I SAM-dependent methyltransferase [Armatimonadetes bacterium]|nr:class I SAM-dependent methyltransferase [Armatimonadota bacterium]